MTAWIAVWQRGPVYWELLVTDEAGNVAETVGTDTLREHLHPGEGFLVAIGLCLFGTWEQGENGSASCAVIVPKQSREDELIHGLLAAGRSDPGTRVH